MDVPEKGRARSSGVVEISSCDGYLHCRLVAPWTEQGVRQALAEIREAARRLRSERILIDGTGWEQPENEFLRFEQGRQLARELPPPLKIAAYAKAEVISGNKITETAAHNRGAWFRMFADEMSALLWLMKD